MVEQQQEKRIDGLTGLRGMLVLMTALGFHYAMLYGCVPASSPLGRRVFDVFYLFGLTAPNVFLIMSGYFMYYKYRPRIRQGLCFMPYLFPRVRKIYPLMIFFTLYLFAIENIGKLRLGYYPLHAGGGELRYSVKALLVSLLGVQSGLFAEGDTMAVNGPSWFVTTLMLCYILFFVVTKFCKSRKAEYGIYIVIGIIGLLFTLHPVAFPLLYECSARGLLFFSAGVIIRIVMEAAGENRRKGLMCAAIVLLGMAGGITLFVNDNDFTVWQTYFTWPCMVYLIINSKVLQKILAFPPLVWVGNMSMSIFLGNLPILATFSYLNLYYGWNADYGSWAVWLAIAAVTLIVGAFTYFVFEKKLDKIMGKRKERQC